MPVAMRATWRDRQGSSIGRATAAQGAQHETRLGLPCVLPTGLQQCRHTRTEGDHVWPLGLVLDSWLRPQGSAESRSAQSMLAISPRRWPLRRRRKTASRCTRAHRLTATNRSAASSSRRISSGVGVRERGGGIGGRARSAVTTVVTWPARFAHVRSRVVAPKTLRRFFAGVAARTASTSSRSRSAMAQLL